MIIHQLEFHSLVAALVPFTRHMLRHHHMFLPLGAMFRAGEVIVVSPDEHQKIATGGKWLQFIVDTLHKHAREPACAAVAYCVDVRLTDTRNGQVMDAVQVVFEHRFGEALHAFFPYEKRGKGYDFSQPMLRMSTRSFFEGVASPYLN